MSVDGAEAFDLSKRVLADRGVEHEQCFVRRVFVELAHDAHDLREFGHQFGLVLQAAGGVDQRDVGVDFLRALHGLKRDASGVRALRRGDEHRRPLAWPRSAIARSRRRGRYRRRRSTILAPAPSSSFGELADGRGFARAVDANDQHDARLGAAGEIEMRLARLQHARNFGRPEASRASSAPFSLLKRSSDELCGDAMGRGRAHVGGDQRFFQFVSAAASSFSLGENRGEAFGELGRGFAQAVEQALALGASACGVSFLVEQTPDHAGAPIRCAPSCAVKRKRHLLGEGHGAGDRQC